MASPPTEIDAVLPLVEADLPRAELLFASLQRYFTGLGRLFVVVPEAQRDRLASKLAPRPGLPLCLRSELEIAPELSRVRGLRGWHKQQVIKLAIVDHVQTPQYLTFDADVIATRPVSPQQLCPNGKAPCTILQEDSHPDWYADSAKLLQRPLVRKAILHNLTPVVMSTDGVRALAAHFEARFQRGEWARGLRALRQRVERLRLGSQPGLTGWRLFLCAGLPWTEYALYYSFLEAYGLFSKWHEEAPVCIYDVQGSLWKADAARFADWSPDPLFEGDGPPFFAVLQSNTKIPAEQLRAKLGDHL